jgi:hypothetical protein
VFPSILLYRSDDVPSASDDRVSFVKDPSETRSEPSTQTAPESLRESEAELMVRAGGGDRDAWHALYDRHRSFVFATALRFLGDEAAARDTSQDVFVSLFSHGSARSPSG